MRIKDFGQEQLVMKPQGTPQAQESASSTAESERKRREAALDKALENTFPASDPVSVEQPEGKSAAA